MKAVGLRYKGYSTVKSKGLVKGLRRTKEGDQADIFNIIQKRTGVHLEVDEAIEGRTRK